MPSDLQLWGLMRRCWHRQHHWNPINMSQNRLLLILRNEGPMKQRELMEHMHIQAGSLSEIIAKVEQSGYIERTRCENDKRNFELRLTDAGRERATVFERERNELATELFSVLDDQQKDALFDILETLRKHWGKLSDHHLDQAFSQDETDKKSE